MIPAAFIGWAFVGVFVAIVLVVVGLLHLAARAVPRNDDERDDV